MIELRAFLPPIRRSWLLAVLNRDTERSTDKSSNDVSVCERAKETCFILGEPHTARSGGENNENKESGRARVGTN